MKISFIATASYPCPPMSYGGEIFWADLCECFSKLGHEVTLYAAAGSKCPPNGTLHYIPEQYNPQGVLYVSADPMRILYRRDILASDFIIDASHTKPTMEEIAYFYQEMKHKTIGILNGTVSHTPLCPRYNIVVGSQKWRELLENGFTQFAGTPWEGQYGRNLSPMPKGAIIAAIHWACNTDFYTPKASVDGHGDASYIKEDYYLWFSRPTGYKGLGRAINIARNTKMKLKLAMPMDMAEHKYWGEEYLKQIADANTKGAQIEFVKLPNNSHHHEAKRELYRRAKALLFTIESEEPFGLTVIEALACGCPVLATRIGAMPEIITQGQNGYLIDIEGPAGDPQNIGAWQRAIGWIEEGLINRENCRKDAVARFDRMVAAKRFIALRERLEPQPQTMDFETLRKAAVGR